MWTAGLRSYVSSEKQLVCADWQLIALWFNLVRDFQKCCVHSDLEIGAPRSLCVQNYNAPKTGDKGPPWWCHYPVSKRALAAGEGAGQEPPPWPPLSQHGVKFKPKSEWDWHKFKIFLTLKPISANRNSNPHKWYAYVVFLMIRVAESAAAHSDKFLELLYLSGQCPHVTDCPCACDTRCRRLCNGTYISMWATDCVRPARKDTRRMEPNRCPSMDICTYRSKTLKKSYYLLSQWIFISCEQK